MRVLKTVSIPILQQTKRKEAILGELLSIYCNVVKEVVDYAWENGITSRKRLHDKLYRELRIKYPTLPSHYIYTAFTMALGIVRSFKKRKWLDLTEKDKPEVSNLNCIMLDDYHLFKIENGCFRLLTEEGHVYFPLKPTRYQEKLLLTMKQGCMLAKKSGEWFLNASIKKEVDCFKPEGFMTYDINEKSIDALLVKDRKSEWLHIDISKVKHIQKRYQQIRERKRRYAKERTKRRVEHLLHVATKFLVEKAEDERVVIATEDIKNINKGINRKSKKLRRRSNLWVHGRTRFMIDYKAEWMGVSKLKDVDSHNNSRMCPVCGGIRARRGHIFRCKECGYETSSHLIACVNILKKATSDEPSRIPFSARALVGLPPEKLVATVKGIMPVREELHGRNAIKIHIV